MSRCDVAVVGAGLAGLWTARLLAEAGARVTLLDQRRSVDQQIRTTGIFVRRTLEDFDLPAGCMGPGIRHVVLATPSGSALALESPRVEFRIAHMAALYRTLLDRALTAGVIWRPGVGCRSLRHEGGLQLLRLGGAREASLAARFVIGADGARSRVASMLGLSHNREWIVGVEDIYRGLPLSGPPSLHCVLSPRFAPGYLAWCVNDGREVHIGVGGYAGRFEPLASLEAFRASLQVPWDWEQETRVERRGGWIPVGGILPNIASPAGLLVGDAAGAVSPLTAGGLDPCLRLSELAARVTVNYLDGGGTAALADYDGTRFRRRFRNRLLLRRLLAGIPAPLLSRATAASLDSAIFGALARKVFFGRGSFPEVPRWDPGIRLVSRAPALPDVA